MNEEPAAENPENPGGIPVAPAAHGPAGSPPTPPSWSYRAGGAPVGPGTPPPGEPAEPPPSTSRYRPPGAPALPGPQRGGPTSFGPPGHTRPPLAVVLLSVFTLGVYALIWHDRINDEMSDFDPRMRVGAASSTVAVTLAWLLGLLVTLAGAARILLDLFKVSLPFDPHFTTTQAYYLLGGLVAVPYIILLLPFSVIAVVMTLERIRIVEDRVGITGDAQLRPTRLIWLLVVPVMGGLVMIGAMQRRLNRVWEQSAPRPAGLSA